MAHEPQEQFLAHLDLVGRIARYTCRRHRSGWEEMEDFESFTKLKLIQDDYAILRKFEGRCRLSTYLTTVLERLYVDHRNKLWGKWRPSAKARRLGNLATTLERLIVRDRHTMDEAFEIVRTTMGVEVSLEELHLLACQVSLAPRRQQVSDDAIARLGSDGARPDGELMEIERLGRARQVRQQLERAVATLPAEDRLLVKLRMSDGLQVAEIARVLKKPTKPLYGRMEAIYRRLRSCLEATGVDAGVVAEVLASPVSASSSLGATWRM
jgi:RNA polymerase sigma factor (sigma-70 family)